jgi:hypothetical protein
MNGLGIVRRVFRSSTIGTLAVATAAAWGCVNDQGPTLPSGAATVRVVQASPDAGSVDVYVNGSKALSSLPFLGDTDVKGVPAGAHTFQVDSAGSTTAALKTPLHLTTGLTYDYVIAGPVSGLMALGGQNTPAGVDLTKASALRIVQAAADTVSADTTLDVYLADSTGAFATALYSFPGLHLFATSGLGPAYTSVVPASYQLIITPGGDTTTVRSRTTLTLSTGQVRTIVPVTNATRTTVGVLVLPDGG